jgi:hypothetical protein
VLLGFMCPPKKREISKSVPIGKIDAMLQQRGAAEKPAVRADNEPLEWDQNMGKVLGIAGSLSGSTEFFVRKRVTSLTPC